MDFTFRLMYIYEKMLLNYFKKIAFIYNFADVF